MKIGIIQMDIALGDPEANRAKVAALIKAALREKPDVLVLPEMWNTGYSWSNITAVADRDGHPTIPMMAQLALENSVNIVAGSVADIRDGSVYNTCYVLGRKGEVLASYSKVHRFGLMAEDQYMAAGDSIVNFDLDGIPCGVIICYDIRFPELTRSLALRGIKVLFVPAQWPNPRLHHWRSLNVARAIENQMYVVGCNRVGGTGTTFCGHSIVTDPWGEVLLEAGEEEGVFMCEINIERVDEVRRTIPVFSDRRPEVYRL